jgi:formamidopyrimidine-DNA glycosylase
MPELPEVELFRRLLLPLVSTTKPVKITSVQHNPPRAWPTTAQFESISFVKENRLSWFYKAGTAQEEKFLLLHMGMTGRITTPAFTCRFGAEDFKVEAYPPKFTYLTFQMGDFEAAFSDGRN